MTATADVTMALVDDLRLAHEYIYMSPSTAKWNKPHYQAAAAAMAWFLRELPGTPLLMKKVLAILQADKVDPAIARADATNLIRAQHGLSASLLDPSGPFQTSTQNPAARSVEDELDELDESHIVDGEGAGGSDRDVLAFDSIAINTAGRTLPAVATARAPAPAAAAAGGGGGDAAADGDGDRIAAAAVAVPAAAPAAAAATAAAAAVKNPPRSQNGNPRRSQNGKKKSNASVCSYLWKRMLCRRANCESSHPDLCASEDCKPKRKPDCPKFHGSFRLEQDKPAMGGASGGRNKPNQGNGQRGAVPPTRSYSSRNNNNSNHNRASARGAGGLTNKRAPTDPRRALEETRRELRVLKGTLGTIVANSTRESAPSRPSGGSSSNNNRTYCDVAKLGHAQQLSSFATVFATALESAMASAGLRLTPYVC